jgi:deoxyribodipyrimidine photo-lyase
MRGLHWFRSDLRLRDNSVLGALADRVDEWLPVFVIDPELLGPDPTRPRERFLFDCLERLRVDLEGRGVPFLIVDGRPEEQLPKLLRETGASWLAYAEATTPQGRRRDRRVREAVEALGVELLSLRDHTIFGPEEIRTKAGGAYSVYTPYRNRWWAEWASAPRHAARRTRLPKRPIPGVAAQSGSLPERLEVASEVLLPTGGERAAVRRLRGFLDGPVGRYATDRDLPAIDGTSKLSPYLRFGAISARRCVSEGLAAAEAEPALEEGIRKWLDEIVWREFYDAVLFERPSVLTSNYRSEYDGLEWNEDPALFEAWCQGRTGFPFVDAGMRQLLETGWMHNRVRMVVASFLTKDLLIDWRQGARFFYEKLVDGDPASNNGGWQWAASTGTDAQPYFRIFNPVSQGQRWDPEGEYIRRFVPELRGIRNPKWIHAPWLADEPPGDYPAPIVDHAARREAALAAFKRARDQSKL